MKHLFKMAVTIANVVFGSPSWAQPNSSDHAEVYIRNNERSTFDLRALMPGCTKNFSTANAPEWVKIKSDGTILIHPVDPDLSGVVTSVAVNCAEYVAEQIFETYPVKNPDGTIIQATRNITVLRPVYNTSYLIISVDRTVDYPTSALSY